ncbi:MAG: hypothetical protein Q7S95_02640 [bacterium]|nr:hypothetical protein [bacterium]
MALPPTIPTSFVPHPSAASVRRHSDLTGAFAFFGYGILGLVFILSIGAFIYSSILASEQSSKDAKLASAIASIDSSTVVDFVHLRDRLTSSKKLLDAHVAMSNFFSALGVLMPNTVGFTAMHLLESDAGQVTVNANGLAKSFNALAATSDALTADGRIKDAIFSDIRVKGNAVTFTLSATLDHSLVAFALPATALETLTATTSTATTSTATTGSTTPPKATTP